MLPIKGEPWLCRQERSVIRAKCYNTTANNAVVKHVGLWPPLFSIIISMFHCRPRYQRHLCEYQSWRKKFSLASPPQVGGLDVWAGLRQCCHEYQISLWRNTALFCVIIYDSLYVPVYELETANIPQTTHCCLVTLNPGQLVECTLYCYMSVSQLCMSVLNVYVFAGWERKLRNVIFRYLQVTPVSAHPGATPPEHIKEPLLYLRKAQVSPSHHPLIPNTRCLVKNNWRIVAWNDNFRLKLSCKMWLGKKYM